MNRKARRNRHVDHRNKKRARGLHVETLNPRLLLDGSGFLPKLTIPLSSRRVLLASNSATQQSQSNGILQALSGEAGEVENPLRDDDRFIPDDSLAIDGPTLDPPTFVGTPLFDDPTFEVPADSPTFSDPIAGEPTFNEPAPDGMRPGDPTFTDPMDQPVFDDPMTGEPRPDDPMMRDPVAGEPTFNEPAPDGMRPGDPTFTDPMDQPVFDDPMTGEPRPDDPMMRDPVAGEPTFNEPAPGELRPGDPIFTDPMDQPVLDDPMTGEPLPDDPAMRDPVAGEPTFEMPMPVELRPGDSVPTDPPFTDPINFMPDGSVTGEPIPHEPGFSDPTRQPEFDVFDPRRIDLELTQTISSTHAEIGDSIVWTLTLTNDADQATSDATGVEVMNFIPPGFEIVGVNDSGNGTYDHGLWRLNESLPPGESRTLQIITEISRVESESIWLKGADADLEVDGQFDVQFEGSRAAFAPAWVSGPIFDPTAPAGAGRVIIGNAFGETSLDVQPTDSYEDLAQKINLVSGSVRAKLLAGDEGTTAALESETAAEYRLVIVTNGFVPTREEGVVRAPVLPSIAIEGVNLWGHPEALAVGQSFTSMPAHPDAPFGSSDATLTFVSGPNRVPVAVRPDSTYRELADQINAGSSSAEAGVRAELFEDASGMSRLEISVAYDTLTPLLMDTTFRTSSIPGVVIARNPAGAVEFHAGEFSAELDGETAFSSAASISSRNASFEVGGQGELRLQGSAVHLSPDGELLLQDYRETDAMLASHAEVVFANEMDVDSRPANDDGDQSEDDEASSMLFVDPKVEEDAHVPVELLTSVNTTTAQAGESVTWTVLVKTDPNATAAAEGIRIQNLVPANTTSTLITVSDKGQIIDGGWSLVEPLAPGDSASITIVTTINHDVPVGTMIRSEPIFVDSATRELFPSSDVPAELVVAGSEVDLELNYSVDRHTVNPFEEARWTLTLTNNDEYTNAVATNVLVENRLPDGFEVVAILDGGRSEYASGIWTVPTLAPGETVSIDLFTRVPDYSPVGIDLMAMAHVLHVDQMDVDSIPGMTMDSPEDDEASAFVVVEPHVDVELNQHMELVDTETGQALRLELAVTNNGENANAAATGVVVRSELPAELDTLRVVASNGEVDYPRFVWTLEEPLEPGATETMVLLAELVAAPPGNVMLTTKSEVVAVDQRDVDSEPSNGAERMGQDDDAVSEIFVEPIMQLDAFVFADQEAVRVGETVTWTVVVRNDQRSNQAADFFVVDGLLPPEVTPISTTASSGEVSDGVWKLSAPLEPGGQETLSIETSVDPLLPGGHVISSAPAIRPVDLGEGAFPAVFAEPATVVVESVIDLELNQELSVMHGDMLAMPNDDGLMPGEVPGDTEGIPTEGIPTDADELQASDLNGVQVIVGELVSLEFKLANNPEEANSPATGVSVAINLPDGLRVVSVEGEGEFDNGTWSVPAMSPGSSASLDIVAKLERASDMPLKVVSQVLTADQRDVDSEPGNFVVPGEATGGDAVTDQREDDVEIDFFETVGNVVDLQLDSQVSAQTAEPGDSVVWTLLLHNNAELASAAATGVRVTNLIPDGVVVQNTMGSHHSWIEGSTWVLGKPLQPGETAHLLLLTTIDDRHPGGALLTSTSFVAAANESDVDSMPGNIDFTEDDSVETTISVDGIVDVELQSSVDRFLVDVSETVNWTFTVANNPTHANMAVSSLVVETGLPSAASVVEVRSPEGTEFVDGSWRINRLEPGDMKVLQVQAVVEFPGEYTSAAQVVSADQPDFDSTPDNQGLSFVEDDQSLVRLAVIDRTLTELPPEPIFDPPLEPIAETPIAETPISEVLDPLDPPIDTLPIDPAGDTSDPINEPEFDTTLDDPALDSPLPPDLNPVEEGLDDIAGRQPLEDVPDNVQEPAIDELPNEMPPTDVPTVEVPGDLPTAELPDSVPADDVVFDQPFDAEEPDISAEPIEPISREDEVTAQAIADEENAHERDGVATSYSVRQEGEVVTIVGTPEGEEFVLDMSGIDYQLSVNGNVTVFDPNEVSEFYIGGGHGNDSIWVIGSSLDEVANMFGRNAEMMSEAYSVKTYDFDMTTLYGFDGNDYGKMFGSTSDDRLDGFAFDSTLTSPDAVNRMISFERVDSFGRGGEDAASVYGGNNPDVYYVMPTHEVMTSDGSTQYTKGFERVDAYGRGGIDFVRMLDSSEADTLSISPSREILQGPGRLRVSKGFEEVEVASQTGGDDTANLVDLRSVDSLFAEGDRVTLRSTDREVRIDGYASLDATAGDDESPTRDVGRVDFVLRTFGSWLDS